ncbi:MmgE/PrpD family protein [Herbaspirillum rubrisubalbicans]|uniref:MmgE/PrpD family protein n=1 Tax=Herbaspirillum rubrisubalbicans TaxID=80842 RepID=UPI000DD3C36D|nr:MmgE/PrpD family protein [Herbaspirillum rubrisubalbicans]
MSGLSRQLAAWCADYEIRFPAAATERANTAIADVVGCMLGGRDDAAVVSAGKFLHGAESLGSAGAITQQAAVSAPWAALVNGCAAHALDFDDNFFPPVTHASASLVPALFALGEEIGAGADAIVHAYIAGLEVEAQIGKLMNPSHYASGWHATSTIGAIGVAAACAVLLRLNEEGVLHAISIASSLAGGSKRQFGSMVKPMHAGFAAMHGVLAARLAASGVTGVEEMLQGKWSFPELYAGSTHDGDFSAQLFPHAPLAIDEYGLVAKLYPSCMSSHLGIDALLAISCEHIVDVAGIAAIDLHMPAFMIANLRYRQPETGAQARFSMNYCAALALVEGVPRLEHFHEEFVADIPAAMKPLLLLVQMHERRTSAQAAALPWGGDCLARITFADGRTLEHLAMYPKGCQQNPLSEPEQREKFLDCARDKPIGIGAEALFEMLKNFSRMGAPGKVFKALRG